MFSLRQIVVRILMGLCVGILPNFVLAGTSPQILWQRFGQPFGAVDVSVSYDGQYAAINVSRIQVQIIRLSDGAGIGVIDTGNIIDSCQFALDRPEILIGETTTTGRLLHKFSVPSLTSAGEQQETAAVDNIRFSSNGQWFSTGGAGNGTGRVFHWPDMTPVTFYDHNGNAWSSYLTAGFFSSNNVILTSNSGQQTEAFYCGNGQSLWVVQNSQTIGGTFRDVSADGTRVLTAYGEIRRSTDCVILGQLDLEGGQFFSDGPRFSQDNSIIVGSIQTPPLNQYKVNVYNGVFYDKLFSYQEHSPQISDLPHFTFVPETNTMVSSCLDTYRWNATSGTLPPGLTWQSGGYACTAFSPNGLMVAGGSRSSASGQPIKGVRVFHTTSGTLDSTVPVSESQTAVAWIDNDRMAIGHDGLTSPIEVWHKAGSSWIPEITIPGYGKCSQILPIDSSHVVTSGWQTQGIRKLDLATGQWLYQYVGEQTSYGVPICMNKTKTVIYAGSPNGFQSGAQMFRASDLAYLGTISAPDCWNAIAISPDGKWLAHASQQTLYLKNLVSGTDTQIDTNSRIFNANALEFTPDSRYLVAGGSDDVRYYSTAQVQRVALFDTNIGNVSRNQGGASSVHFAPTGDKLAVGRWDGSLLMTRVPFLAKPVSSVVED